MATPEQDTEIVRRLIREGVNAREPGRWDDLAAPAQPSLVPPPGSA